MTTFMILLWQWWWWWWQRLQILITRSDPLLNTILTAKWREEEKFKILSGKWIRDMSSNDGNGNDDDDDDDDDDLGNKKSYQRCASLKTTGFFIVLSGCSFFYFSTDLNTYIHLYWFELGIFDWFGWETWDKWLLFGLGILIIGLIWDWTCLEWSHFQLTILIIIYMFGGNVTVSYSHPSSLWHIPTWWEYDWWE